MSFELDWDVLNNEVSPQKDRLRFAEVQHLFKKVAWDAYKPLSGSETLWELREENGEKYLYAIYGDADELVSTASMSKWSAICDKEGRNITLSYNNTPIKRFSAAEYSFTPAESEEFATFLQNKTADSNFVSELLATLPDSKRVAVAALLTTGEE